MCQAEKIGKGISGQENNLCKERFKGKAQAGSCMSGDVRRATVLEVLCLGGHERGWSMDNSVLEGSLFCCRIRAWGKGAGKEETGWSSPEGGRSCRSPSTAVLDVATRGRYGPKCCGCIARCAWLGMRL